MPNHFLDVSLFAADTIAVSPKGLDAGELSSSSPRVIPDRKSMRGIAKRPE
jgi:hypothetical protein